MFGVFRTQWLKNGVVHYVRRLSTTNRYVGKTGGQVVYEKLKEHGVKDVFLYSGGAIMPVVDAFYKGGISYYINTHEQSGGHAATGYAKSSGKTGVSIVTSGPALTNSVTALTDAMTDSTPLIVISGQVALKHMGTNAFQECPSVDITTPITKWSYCVKSVFDIPKVMDKAFKIANEGKPGPVHIDLPKCVSTTIFTEMATKNKSIREVEHYNADIDNDIDIEEKKKIKQYKYPLLLADRVLNISNIHPVKSDLFPSKQKTTLDKGEIEKLLLLLHRAHKPLILLGKGALTASSFVREFVEVTKIPVTSTIHAMGIVDETSEYSLQFLGMHGLPASNLATQNADLIICLGSRFDDRITGNIEKFAPKARHKKAPGIVHVNICANELNNVIETQHNFQMDCRDFLEQLLPIVKRERWFEKEIWHIVLNNWKQQFPFSFERFPEAISTQEVIFEMNKTLQKHEQENSAPFTITTGVGNHQMMAAQFITWRHPNKFITSGSLGVMGTGVPYSIGVQIANPDELVVNIDGDGSFHHTLAELKTVMDYNLPIKIAIMNDGHMSMVKTWEELFFNKRHVATSLSRNPDYSMLAKSFGMHGIMCDTRETLPEKVEEFINYPGAVLCDFRVQSDMCMPLVSPGSALDDIILTKPKEKEENYFKTQEPPS